jgi:hypothetical protein
MSYTVSKGPADPFRGDWYIPEEVFPTLDEAVALALALTEANQRELGTLWVELGYEWSVFSAEEDHVWEGYKAVQLMVESGRDHLRAEDGFLE